MTSVMKLVFDPKIDLKSGKNGFFAAYFFCPKLHFLLFFCSQGENVHIELAGKCILNFRILTRTPK